jgi:CheY-like chemotaxis protein
MRAIARRFARSSSGVALDARRAAREDSVEKLDRTFDLRGLHVLVVDDNADAREIVAWTLNYFGAVVTRASSPAVALALLHRITPDLIVSDFSMPGEDGFSFMRRVRALPAPVRDVPAIALTGFDGIANAAAARAAGFNAYLVKPLEVGAFCRELTRLGFAVTQPDSQDVPRSA